MNIREQVIKYALISQWATTCCLITGDDNIKLTLTMKWCDSLRFRIQDGTLYCDGVTAMLSIFDVNKGSKTVSPFFFLFSFLVLIISSLLARFKVD